MPESPSLKLVSDNAAPPPAENAGLDPVSKPGFSEIVAEPESKPTGFYAEPKTAPPPSGEVTSHR